jgi:hypothetical protein
LADYLQLVDNEDYLQPVSDEVYLQPVGDEVYLQPACGCGEHCQAEIYMQSVNLDNKSDPMQALNDLPGYTIHDSRNRFAFKKASPHLRNKNVS